MPLSHLRAGLSAPSSLLGLLEVSPIGFQSQMFWGLICLVLWLWCLMWGVNPLLLREKLRICEILLIVGHHAVGGVLSRPFLLPISVWPFYPLLCRNCSASFQTFFRENVSTSSWASGVSVGGGEFRIFLHHHVELPPQFYF